MTTQPLMFLYERVGHASRAMRDAARREDWLAVTRLAESCRPVVAELRERRHDEPLSPDEAHRRNEILREILQHDAEIRGARSPWLATLDNVLRARSPDNN